MAWKTIEMKYGILLIKKKLKRFNKKEKNFKEI